MTETKQKDDPIVMYLIVRESLGMSVGKIAAQVGHAVGLLYRQYSNLKLVSNGANQHLLELWERWEDQLYRKVCLRADEKEWVKVKQLPNHVVVVDSGLTELLPNSETVIGLYPQVRSASQQTIVKRLQALK